MRPQRPIWGVSASTRSVACRCSPIRSGGGPGRGMQNSLKAAVESAVKPTFRQHQHNLTRRSCGKFRLVAGGPHGGASLNDGRHRPHHPQTADASAATSTNPRQGAGPTHSASTVSHALILTLQTLLAIDRRRQSSLSSGQKAGSILERSSGDLPQVLGEPFLKLRPVIQTKHWLFVGSQ